MAEEQKSRLRRIRRSLRNAVVKPLTALALVAVPRLYVWYMKFVWKTSRVEFNDFARLHDITQKDDGAVALLWHEEVFTVAYAYCPDFFEFQPHTLASAGTSGEIITRMLELCGYKVFRGGSTSKRSRRRAGVVAAMIEHMKTTHSVTYGITVDGSQGPAYRMKVGGILIARECGKPVALARTWYKRAIRLNTWDRTAIPLPFNRITYYLRGPYYPPEDANTDAGLQRFLLQMEDELIDLAILSYREMGQPLPPNLVKRSAEERKENLVV
ncbi:MAG: lysophospholipid acyltransferase family protein [Myxococcota bacterium]